MIINLSKIDFGGIAAGGKSKPEEVFDIQPTTTDQTITPTEGSVFSGGTVRAVTSDIDNNIVSGNIKEGVSILGVEGSLKEETGVFVVPPQVRLSHSLFMEVPSNFDFSNLIDMSYMFADCYNLTIIPQLDTSGVTNMSRMFSNCKITDVPQLDTSKVTNMSYMFNGCNKLISIPQLDTSRVTNMEGMFSSCGNIRTIPQLDTSKVTNMSDMFSTCISIRIIPQLDTSKATKMGSTFSGCSNLIKVEGIDFSGLTSDLKNLFGYTSSMPKITRFIVNGKINVSMSDNYSIKALTGINYDSVKSILTAASNTDNTKAKTLAFNRTMTDQNGELAALVTQCAAKGWTITGLILQ